MKYKCECGKEIATRHIKNHNKTKRHQEYLKIVNQTPADTQ